jgi:hypothetical protein
VAQLCGDLLQRAGFSGQIRAHIKDGNLCRWVLLGLGCHEAIVLLFGTQVRMLWDPPGCQTRETAQFGTTIALIGCKGTDVSWLILSRILRQKYRNLILLYLNQRLVET